MPVEIMDIEIIHWMSSQHRRCPACGAPLMAIMGERYLCPRCGRPTYDDNAITRAEARALRIAWGLVPCRA